MQVESVTSCPGNRNGYPVFLTDRDYQPILVEEAVFKNARNGFGFGTTQEIT